MTNIDTTTGASSRAARIAAVAAVTATMACGLTVEAEAGSTTAPGFTSGLPIYAIFPEGLTLVNQTLMSFRDLPGGADARVNAEVPFFVYQSDWSVLGGKITLVFAPTISEAYVEGGARASGFFNTYGGVQINWQLADGLYAGYRFSGYLPQDGGTALDYGTIEQRAGLTYLKDGWQATANFMYGTPLDHKSGKFAPDYGIVDWSVTRAFGKIGLGVVGHASQDLNSPGLGGKQRQIALGGLVSFDFGGATLQAKLTRDVSEKNYGSKETVFWTNLIVPLWSPEQPAAPLVTKY